MPRGCRKTVGRLALAFAVLVSATAGATDVLTYHNNNSRGGAQTHETTLTPASISSATFGKKYTFPVDSYLYAQPLYVGGVGMPDGAVHNIVLAASTHATVYAFDADGNNPTSGYLWSVSFLPSGERFPTANDIGGCPNPEESGIVGTAIGMAMNGMRPVVEMQFDAFAYPAFEQITSHLAKLRNRTRGRVALPVVIRIPYGGGIGGVEHHCDSSEVYYTHTAGLRVVTPGTAGDAYALLRRAIGCPDPVIFLEPKRRYWSRESAAGDHAGPALDRAVVRRPGTDVTLIAYGGTLATALEAAGAAAAEGRSVEVVDLRSLSPSTTRP